LSSSSDGAAAIHSYLSSLANEAVKQSITGESQKLQELEEKVRMLDGKVQELDDQLGIERDKRKTIEDNNNALAWRLLKEGSRDLDEPPNKRARKGSK
jgi:TolA-binding protein